MAAVLASGLVMMCWGGVGRNGKVLHILWVVLILDLLISKVVIAEGNVVLRLPSIEAVVVALPLDEAVLFIWMGEELLLIHFSLTTRSTSYSVSLYIVKFLRSRLLRRI